MLAIDDASVKIEVDLFEGIHIELLLTRVQVRLLLQDEFMQDLLLLVNELRVLCLEFFENERLLLKVELALLLVIVKQSFESLDINLRYTVHVLVKLALEAALGGIVVMISL